jgi:DNA-binding FrmR family transcriptional regulator
MAEPLKIVEGSALTAQQKKDLLNRLARVEGQLRGIQKLMALADVPGDCDAVAQQMAAARKALDRSFVQLLTASIVTHTANAADVEEAKRSAAQLAACSTNSPDAIFAGMVGTGCPPSNHPYGWAPRAHHSAPSSAASSS